MLTHNRNNLRDAHRGYHYQDLATAVAMAEVLAAGRGAVTVDRKEFEGDKFDDITIESSGARERRQLKWTENEARPLCENDFKHKSSSVRIDHLVSSFACAKRSGVQDVVRLAVCWQRPSDEDLLHLVELDSSARSSFPNADTRIYRLNAERVWPLGGDPRWDLLRGTDRAAFMDFTTHFLIETELPPCSADLTRPGPVENMLFAILRERIGIGEYPNHGRSVPDVAALLISFAAWARANSAVVSIADIAREIALQTDFGAIAQRFPVRQGQAVERQTLRAMLRRSIAENRVTELIGAPGTGKSWELTSLADELRNQGAVVATHYCYVEPADEHVHQRITIDAMCGNLISELIRACPGLEDAKAQRYSATTAELQRLLVAVGSQVTSHPVVLIVDGLDHIDRVAAESPHVTRSETSIVEELAALSWPPGISLVVGSQPGSHLAPLDGMTCRLEVPEMTIDETAELAHRLGFGAVIAAAPEPAEEIIELLHTRTEGNALYATMLARGAIATASRGQTVVDYLNESPAIDGQVSQYYSYLYEKLREGRPVADLLGVLDFAVTEAELSCLVDPYTRRWIHRALADLRPLLTDIAGQGGIRVFHESFRRFIIERDGDASGALPGLLAPVIDWLHAKGFFEDTRSYRYLPMCYGRAVRYSDLFALFGPDFIARSIEHGRPKEDVERALRYASVVAANATRFVDLTRCAQLLRSCHTCFEEHLNDPEQYWRTYLRLFGPEAAAERLVLNGRAVVGRHAGLRICSLIDDLGGLAPWATYLNLPAVEFVHDVEHSVVGETLAARLHGEFRTSGPERASEWAAAMLQDQPDTISWAVVRPVAARWARFHADAVERFASDAGLRAGLRSYVALAAAEALVDAGAGEVVIRLRTLATEAATDLDAISRCIAARCIPELPPWDLHPERMDLSDSRPRGVGDESAIDTWLAEVAVIAVGSPDRLSEVRKTLARPGWYWKWLSFCTSVCEAEAIIATDVVRASEIASRAFEMLARGAAPFDGSPRAVDLYFVRGRIRDTIRRGLACLDVAHFDRASVSLLDAASRTMAYLQGSPGGPLPWGTLLELLMPFGDNLATREAVIQRALEIRSKALKQGQLYALQGEIELHLACLYVSCGRQMAALENWRAAVQCFTAYGFRKDVTIFELMDSLSSFSGEPGVILRMLERLNPLLAAVVAHTDGRSTKHAPNAALRLLAEHDPVAAATVVVEDQLGPEDATNWISEEAVRTCVRAFKGKADPVLYAFARSMLRFEVETGGEAVRRAAGVVEAIEATVGASAASREELVHHLIARVEGDAQKCDEPAFDLVRNAAETLGLRVARSSVAEARADTDREHSTGRGAATRRRTMEPPPPRGASVLETMAWVRQVVHQHRDEEVVDVLANTIGYVCLELDQQRSPDTAERLIRFTSRCLPEYGEMAAGVLSRLAQGFERLGATSLAGISYALAFTSTHGGSGWHVIGDERSRHLFDRSFALGPRTATAVIAQEVARKASDGYAMGLTEAIVACVAQWDTPEARRAWEAAFEVVAYRLPTVEGREGWLPPFRSEGLPDWTVDEGLVAALISYSRHPERDRRTSALLALARAIAYRPEAVGRPLAHCLAKGADRAPLWTFHLLQVLWEAEPEPFLVTTACYQALASLGGSSLFGFRVLIDALLVRAGLPVVGMRDGPALDTAKGSPEVAKRAWAFAGRDRLDELAEFDRSFPRRFAARFERLVYADEARSRSRSRFKLMAEERVDPSRWVPVVQYEEELMHQALQETASGVATPRSLVGPDRAEFEFALLDAVAPDLRTQLAYAASRRPRPLVSRPGDTAAGVGQIETALAEEANAGWVRIGIFEREYRWGERSWFAEPAEEITRVSGAHVLGMGQVDAESPVGMAFGSTWGIEGEVDPEHLFTRIGAGPVTGLFFISDTPLGRAPLLILPESLIHRFELRPRRWPGALVLEDSSGQAMARFSYWCVGSIRRHERPGRLEGCELMVHPDLAGRISGLARSPLVNVTIVLRSAIASQ